MKEQGEEWVTPTQLLLAYMILKPFSCWLGCQAGTWVYTPVRQLDFSLIGCSFVKHPSAPLPCSCTASGLALASHTPTPTRGTPIQSTRPHTRAQRCRPGPSSYSNSSLPLTPGIPVQCDPCTAAPGPDSTRQHPELGVWSAKPLPWTLRWAAARRQPAPATMHHPTRLARSCLAPQLSR